MWDIEVELEGNPYPHRLCRCHSPEVVAAIVQALCRAMEARPVTIRRVEPEQADEPPGMDAFKGSGQ